MKKIIKDSRFPTQSSLCLVLVIACIFTLLMGLSGCGSSSPDVSAVAVAKKAAQAYADGDASAYYDLLAPGYTEYAIGEDGEYKTADEFKENVIQREIDEMKDEFADRCGKDYSVEVSLCGYDLVEDKDTLERAKKELVSEYKYKDGEIENVNVIEIGLSCSGNNKNDTVYKSYNCVEVDGEWYIHRPDIEALSES